MLKLRSGILGLTLASVVALAAGSANAADMYRGEPGGYKDGPVYSPVAGWNGLYVGVNGGYGWTSDSSNSASDFSPAGGFGGGQIGYNWQGALGHHHLVLGVEADIQGADISDSISASDGRNSASLKQSLNWFGTVRGRVGYAMDRTLVYATGGFAFGGVETTGAVNFPGLAAASGGANETQTGYVLGGGIEHKLSPSWSLKGEYQFLSLDASDKITGPLGLGSNDRTEVHTIRAGLNYHVGNSYEPLK